MKKLKLQVDKDELMSLENERDDLRYENENLKTTIQHIYSEIKNLMEDKDVIRDRCRKVVR
jgi:cell division protein FtsB